MEYQELIQARYSVRKFRRIAVEEEKIQAILKAARLAPTACNLQPQKLLVLQSKESLALLKKCTTCHFNAPLAILVCADSKQSWKRPFDNDDSGTVDAAIVGTHLMLEVVEQGLGTTWVGYFDPAKVRTLFALPDHWTPVAIFPIGYPARDAEPTPRHTQRKMLRSTVKFL